MPEFQMSLFLSPAYFLIFEYFIFYSLFAYAHNKRRLGYEIVLVNL
jgi:hypothetical protein